MLLFTFLIDPMHLIVKLINALIVDHTCIFLKYKH